MTYTYPPPKRKPQRWRTHATGPYEAPPETPQIEALRGVLFGDQLHQPGAIPRLEGKLDALADRLDALAAQMREAETQARMARARWRWMLIGAASAGALAGGGVWSLVQHLAGLI